MSGETPLEDLFPEAYLHLLLLARHLMARESSGHLLEPAALVHEGYLRLARQRRLWNGRHEVVVAAARTFREVLVDHARRLGRAKRGGGWRRVPFADRLAVAPGPALEAGDRLALQEALARHAAREPEEARVVQLRFECGLTVAETARAMGLSKRTVEQDWTRARRWLRSDLERTAA